MAKRRPVPSASRSSFPAPFPGSNYLSPANLPVPLPLLILLIFIVSIGTLYLLSKLFRYDRVRPLTRKERQVIAKTIPSDKNHLPAFRFVVTRRLVVRHVGHRLAIIPVGLLLRGPPSGSSMFAPFGEWGWMIFDYLAAAQLYQNGDQVALSEATKGLGPVRWVIATYVLGEKYWKNCGKIGPVFWVDVTPGREVADAKTEEDKMPKPFRALGGERYLLRTRYGSLTFEYKKDEKKFVNV